MQARGYVWTNKAQVEEHEAHGVAKQSGERRIPYAASALVSGDLGACSKRWDGWRVQADTLTSPDGWKISLQDALTVPLLRV